VRSELTRNVSTPNGKNADGSNRAQTSGSNCLNHADRRTVHRANTRNANSQVRHETRNSGTSACFGHDGTASADDNHAQAFLCFLRDFFLVVVVMSATDNNMTRQQQQAKRNRSHHRLRMLLSALPTIKL
jgi:hypothetical protein